MPHNQIYFIIEKILVNLSTLTSKDLHYTFFLTVHKSSVAISHFCNEVGGFLCSLVTHILIDILIIYVTVYSHLNTPSLNDYSFFVKAATKMM